jgi:hypothetical protein
LTPHKISIGHSNNKASQSAYDLGTKDTRARKIINNHKHNPLVIHNNKNVDHKGNSSQNRGRNQSTESQIYTGDEHHDETNMGHNQSIVTQSANKSSSTRSKYNLTSALHKRRTNQAAHEVRYKIEQL